MAACDLDYKSIRQLSPFCAGWVLKAKVVHRFPLSTYTRGTLTGHAFTVYLQDEECAQISASFFDEAALRLFPALQLGQIYELEGGEVKLEKEKYRRFGCPIHLIFGNRSIVRQVPPASFKHRSSGLIALHQLPSLMSGAEKFIDLIALARDIGPVIATNNYQKRSLQLVDSSGFSVQLNLWGEFAYNRLLDLPHEKPPVIYCRCVKLTSYANITVCTEANISTLRINPLDCEETQDIESWRSTGYSDSMHFIPLTSMVPKAKPPSTFMTVKQLASVTATTYCVLRIRIRALKYDESNHLWYRACPNARCAKQLVEKHQSFYCTRCFQDFETPLLKYRVQVMLADAVSHVWVVAYDEVGESLFGMSASRLKRLSETEADQFTSLLESVLHAAKNASVQVRVSDGSRKYILTHLLEPDLRRDASLMLADLV